MISVSRAGWNARPPECSITQLNKSKITNFIVHYSGEVRSQTVRSIQDYCIDDKGHCDIDYNRIVRGEYDYMGRGWGTGGHTLNNNSTSYGVCMIGVDGDATDADFRTIREIYDQVCAELGRPLNMTTHRGVLGASYTSCPGTELHNWVMLGMPYPNGGNTVGELYTNSRWGDYPDGKDRAPDQHILDTALAVIFGVLAVPVVRENPDGTETLIRENPWIVDAINDVRAAIDGISVPPPAAIDQEMMNVAVLNAIKQPDVLAAIAKAVTDEIGT